MRLALPLSVVAGVGIAFIGPIGLVVFFAALIYCINRYGRVHPGSLSPAQGARLGAFNGLASYIVVGFLQTALFRQSEFRQQLLAELQKRWGGDPNPYIQQFVHWVATDQGYVVLVIGGMVFMLVIFLVLSSFAGAMTITLLRRENR